MTNYKYRDLPECVDSNRLKVRDAQGEAAILYCTCDGMFFFGGQI